jgi:transcriptional regulator with XRE-family HTH domain
MKFPQEIRSLGQALYYAREQRRFTVRQLARKVGLSPAFICDIEHDRRSTTKLPELAQALKIPLRELESRAGVNRDLTDWLSHHPKLIQLLRDIQSRRRPMVY